MAASSNNRGQPKYGLRNAFDGLRSVLPAPVAAERQVYPILHACDALRSAPSTSAFDGLRNALAVPFASGHQVYPKRSAFDGLIMDPPAPASTCVESSSGMKHLPYDVFINHHGGDAKHTVASSIYNSLDATGLRVFLDINELKLGDFFPRALEEAMGNASLHIAIFSENYAESPWCLAELAFMLQTDIKFIPIFYHVEPSTLRWAIEGKGIYADAISKHEIKSRYTSAQLQLWKWALHKASLYTGETINNQGDEQKVVTNVVNRVLKELKKVRLEVAKHPVGLDEAVQDFEEFVCQSAGPIQIVGIWGLGGSGKTTLAKELYNKKCQTFAKSSFLIDLREAARKELLHEKQKRLLEHLDLKGKSADFDNVDEGKEILKSRLRLKYVSVLIVLDDVDHIDQLDAVLPAKESLGPGSLIIVTTREMQVLRAWDISAIYKIRKLNAAHAEELFCWHAFGQPSPLSGFEGLTKKFINACHGLPLSLKVLGGQLYGESSENYWQSQLEKLSRIVPEDIKSRLKISYDALDKEEKEMFLDIACFFIGCESSWAIAAWDGSDWNGIHGWQKLVNKCLVELDEKNLVKMHDHLRDLGREIANQQYPYRLWSQSQIIEIQPQQEAIRIRGIANAIGDNCYPRQGEIIIRTNQGERSLAPCSLGLKIFIDKGYFINQEHSELSRELVLLQCDEFEHKNLPSGLSFKKLRILKLSNTPNLEDLWERDVDALLQLRELVIQKCNSLRGFPRSISHLKNLKKILISEDWMGNDTLSDLPREFCHLQLLEHLEIKRCINLSSLPSNFGELTNLQHLNLEGCTVLKMLPDSFKKLALLEYLNLNNCAELTIKSELHIFENMAKLGYLNLDGCRKLEELRLPEVVSLTKLYLGRTSLKELPANIFQLTKLTELTIGSDFFTTLPTSLGNLSSLTTLKILGCEKLESLPDSLENLNFLRDLCIVDSGVKCLPKSFIHLQSLRIENTPISELSYGSGCMLKTIKLEGTKVAKISIFGDCYPFLETLDLSCNEDLRELETLPATLKILNVSNCKVLKDIRGVRGLKNLQVLLIMYCEELEVLPCFTEFASLEYFAFVGNSEVKKIAGLQELRSLRMLRIELDELPSLAELTSLEKFELIKCHKLERIEGLESLRSLVTLRIDDCPELDTLPSFEQLTFLKEIKLKKCNKLEKIEGLESLRSLERLTIDDCPELNGLPSLAELTSLKEFELGKCHKLEEIEGLESLRSLKKLKISDYPEFYGLPSLAELTSLKEFELIKCNKLEKIEGLESLRSLKTLRIDDCPELDGLPSLAELTYLQICHTSISELSYGLGCMLKTIMLTGTEVSKISICGDCCPFLETLELSLNEDLRELETLPATLKSLKVFQCKVLKDIKGVRGLKKLKNLTIRYCEELDGFPCFTELGSLEIFTLKGSSKIKRIAGLQELRSLRELRIELDELPSLAELTSLKTLKLQKCNKWEKTESLGRLRSLEELKISYCPELEALPSLPEITSLKKFKLRRCHKLKRIEGLECLRSLEMLEIVDCPELDGIPSLAELTSLKEFELIKCHKLEKIEGLESLRSLKTLRIDACEELHNLPSLAELTFLKKVELEKCNKLEKVKGLNCLRSLETLKIDNCPELDGLPNLTELTSLNNFELLECHKLEKIEGLDSLTSLRKLTIRDCPELDGLPSLAELTSLKEYELIKCHKLEKIEGIDSLRSLRMLMISDCPALDGLPNLKELTSLREFKLGKCHKLDKVEGLESLKSLKMLTISDCPELDGLPSLKKLTSLEEFELGKCHKLNKVEGLDSLKSLKMLTVSDCPELDGLPSLRELTSLEKFDLRMCHKLEKIEGLEGLTSLDKLEVHARSKAPCIVSLEHCERLKSLVVVGNDVSVVEPFISNMQKWPGEVIICSRAVVDVGLLKNFFTSFPLKNVVEFGLFGGLKLRRLESSTNANAILICFVIDYVHPNLRFHIYTDRGNRFYTELANGKWLWMGVFPQGSDWLQSNRYEIWASSEDKDVKVKEAWLVTGEEGSILEAFHRLSQS